GRLHRELQVDLARDARFIGLESLVFGREAMGETVARGFFRDRWRIRREGRLVHADDLRFDLANPGDIVDPAILGPNRVVATLVALLPDDAESLDLAVASCRTRLAGTAGGVSRIGIGADAKIVVRLAARSSYVLRRHLLPVIALFLRERSMPKVWSL
ncbi:MAG: urease accessory protein UreD, partial [Oricola sp.]|nr:urease accessory protein UreD [Oricola sp.]